MRFLSAIFCIPTRCEERASKYKNITLYQDKLTTDKKPTVGYLIPDEIPTTCFQLCELV